MVGIGLAVSAVIVLAFAQQRAGVEYPFEIPIYRHLILFQDYYFIFPFMAVLVAALLGPVRAAGAHLAQWCG
ncbi:MAG TPA: hypothetical protein VMN03_08045, partial [Burkholderiales bacterium]|nr:hypothetical protein [Burkholderiales bacterium]